jgi:hypothetical protein
MHIIEQLFGLSPDGGTGATELWSLLTALLAIASLLWKRTRPRHAPAARPEWPSEGRYHSVQLRDA